MERNQIRMREQFSIPDDPDHGCSSMRNDSKMMMMMMMRMTMRRRRRRRQTADREKRTMKREKWETRTINPTITSPPWWAPMKILDKTKIMEKLKR
jgi:hypothetical protein